MTLNIGKPQQIKNFYNSEWRETEEHINIENGRIVFLEQIKIPEEAVKGKKVLDAGCGTGTHSVVMAKYFNAEVTSVDIEQECINIAKNLASKNNVDIHGIVDNIAYLKVPENSFDVIVSIGVVHHTNNTQNCLDSFYKALKPGGICFMSVARKSFLFTIQNILNPFFRDLPGFLKPFFFTLIYIPTWIFAQFTPSRVRFTPLKAALRDALLCPFHQVESDKNWCNFMEKAGFEDVHLNSTWSIFQSEGVYIGKKPI